MSLRDPHAAAHFRQTLGHFPTGVTIVTGLGESGPSGLAVGSFMSVSLAPPLIAVCPGKTSRSWPAIRETGAFCVNILADDQEELCRLFAISGGDKFDGIGWRLSPAGTPIIDDVLAWIDCELIEEHDAGDHTLVLGRVRALHVERSVEPLVFYRGGFGR